MAEVVSVQEAASALGPSAALIDVREPAEYRVVHAEGAELLPLSELERDAKRFCELSFGGDEDRCILNSVVQLAGNIPVSCVAYVKAVENIYTD